MTADGLERLEKLHSDAALTDDEFDVAKQELLSELGPHCLAPAAAAPNARS